MNGKVIAIHHSAAMQINTNFHAFPHWESINPIKSRVEIAFDLGIDPAKTNVAQLRRDLFATLNNDVLPQIAQAAPPGADLHAIGSTDSDFDVTSVDFTVAKNGAGKWRKEGDGANAILSGNVAVTLQTDYPIAAADALQTVRASVADDIAALIAESYGQIETKAPSTVNAFRLGRTRFVGHYTNAVGDSMNVAKGKTRGTYAFSIKDSLGNIRLESIARNFTDMSMVIEVWKMTRAEVVESSQAAASKTKAMDKAAA